MAKVERAVVSLRLSDHREVDVDVPLFTPWSELKEAIWNILRELYPAEFMRVEQITLIIYGTPIREEDTFGSRGVLEGAILDVRIL